MIVRNTIRTFATKMTAAERNAALRDANEKMRQYYINRPPIEVLQRKKKRNNRDSEHLIQFAAASAFLAAFLITPFIGKKIARDEEFRKKFIPEWYDFSIEKPDYAWTRQELHEQMVDLKRFLHEQAIAGEFTPEKLDEMRRVFPNQGPKDDLNDLNGWNKLHPGVDDDEDVEDDDEDAILEGR
mmetsp:Transcript_2486/g.2699  ORF Transcript_2486/g.2699 Transcript_2486/m.2699 type:complete len:184 (-) Transcript_2486:173-724(-)